MEKSKHGKVERLKNNVPSLFKRGGTTCGGRFYFIITIMFFRYKNHLKKYAQNNRKNSTKSEWLVRNCLLKWDKLWYRFLRQKSIEWYILDFYCPKLKLCIEIDGESHEWVGDYDEKRDSVLMELWIKTVRYKSNRVLYNLEWVGLDIENIVVTRADEIKSPILKDTSPFKTKGV